MNHELLIAPGSNLHIGGHTRVSADDILFCEGDRNYTHVHFKRLPKLTLSVTLRILHERPGESDFLRPNRSTVVSKACIAEFDRFEIRLLNGLVIPIARRRRRFVRKNLPRHLAISPKTFTLSSQTTVKRQN